MLADNLVAHGEVAPVLHLALLAAVLHGAAACARERSLLFEAVHAKLSRRRLGQPGCGIGKRTESSL